MKNLFIFLSLVIVISFLSCEKDPENTEDGVIVLQVDGKEWKSLKEKTSVTMTSSTMNISGIAADGSSISLTLNGKTAKTYTLTQSSSSNAIFKQTSTSSFSSTQGDDAAAKVVISEVNTTDSLVTGSFNFTGFRTSDGKKVVITSGSINKVKIAKPATTTGGTGFFKCKINGTQFNAALLSAIKNPVFDVIILSGFGSSGSPQIAMNVDINVTVGSYPLSGLTAFYSPSTSSSFNATSGTIKITKHDKTSKKLEGTFNFDGENTSGQIAKITEGSFSLNY